jgi:cytochrome P450
VRSVHHRRSGQTSTRTTTKHRRREWAVARVGSGAGRSSRSGGGIRSTLAESEIDAERLSDEEIFAFLLLILPAGVETTYRASGNLLVAMLTEPALMETVRADRGC